MNLRSTAAPAALALGLLFSGCAATPQGPNENLAELSARNTTSYEDGAAAAKGIHAVGIDLMTYVIGDELLNHTSDEAITHTAQLAERYAEKLGWEVNAEDRGIDDLTRSQRFIAAHMYIRGALSVLKDSNPEEHDRAIAQIEKLRGLLKNGKFDEAVTLMHTHDPVTGMGKVPSEDEDHFHPVTSEPSDIDKSVGTHPHGPDFGQHEHN